VLPHLDDKPVRSRTARTDSHPDGTLTVATSRGDVVELNAIAAALWSLCDGQTSVREMIFAADALFSASSETIAHDVLAALVELRRRTLIQ
jgi:hypothetical protein